MTPLSRSRRCAGERALGWVMGALLSTLALGSAAPCGAGEGYAAPTRFTLQSPRAVPAGEVARASVPVAAGRMPAAPCGFVTAAGGKPLALAPGVASLPPTPGAAVCQVVAGTYDFAAPAP